VDKEDLIYRLRKRAEIRRQINTRKSVQEGAPDRIADLLDEAADALESKDRVARYELIRTVEAKLKEKNA
jgi:S-adenosylmethionine synthetase